MDKLECRILGTAPGKPVLGKNQAAVWLKIGNRNLLIDCGEGTSQQLMKYGLDGDVLDAIIISHYHPDHCCGLFLTLQLLYLQNRTKPLSIFLPERVPEFKKLLDFFYLFQGRITYKFRLKEMKTLPVFYNMIKPISNDHLKGYSDIVIPEKLDNTMISWSYLVEKTDPSLLYTSDFYSGLSEYIDQIDYLIVDSIHPVAEEIMKLADKTRYKVILNHGMSDELSAQLHSLCPQRFIVAEDGYLLGD